MSKKSIVDIMFIIQNRYSTGFGYIQQHIHKSRMFHVEHTIFTYDISTIYCQSY